MARKVIRYPAVVIAFGIIIQGIMPAAAAAGCFSVVVGKDASADGSVIMAHNEDDSPPQVVHHRKVPRMKHEPGDMLFLTNGGALDQVDQTWAFIWAEIPGMTFSDSYINEWGVGIASDNCPSREDSPEYTYDGINYMLRRLVAERARTAREGVLLAGDLIERFGYDASGRTYVICDPDEGWLFCAVNGKNWLAQRVPDDEVAVVANTYTVREVGLSDSSNSLASADIIDYAVSRGWHNPTDGQEFDFVTAFSDPDVAADSGNLCRQWRALTMISRDSILFGPKLPFSVKPKQKVDVAAVMEILRDHYEDSDLYGVSSFTGSPHEGPIRPICCRTTQTSFVAQLRGDLPLDIGIVYWMCLGPPCTSFYIPFYFGADGFPAGYATDIGVRPDNDYVGIQEYNFVVNEKDAYKTFYSFYLKIHNEYDKLANKATVLAKQIENRALSEQARIEETALGLYASDKTAAADLLSEYSNDLYISALEAMQKFISKR